MIETKLILSLIFCFHITDAGFRDALDKHTILTLSDFASQMVSLKVPLYVAAKVSNGSASRVVSLTSRHSWPK